MNDYLKQIVNQSLLPKSNHRNSPRQDQNSQIHQQQSMVLNMQNNQSIEVASKQVLQKQKRLSDTYNYQQEKLNFKRNNHGIEISNAEINLKINHSTNINQYNTQIGGNYTRLIRPTTTAGQNSPLFSQSPNLTANYIGNINNKQLSFGGLTLKKATVRLNNQLGNDDQIKISKNQKRVKVVRNHSTNKDVVRYVNNSASLETGKGVIQSENYKNSHQESQNGSWNNNRQHLNQIYGLNNDLSSQGAVVQDKDQISGNFQFHNDILKEAQRDESRQSNQDRMRLRLSKKRPSTQQESSFNNTVRINKNFNPFDSSKEGSPPQMKPLTINNQKQGDSPNKKNFLFFQSSTIQPRMAFSSNPSPRPKLSTRRTKAAEWSNNLNQNGTKISNVNQSQENQTQKIPYNSIFSNSSLVVQQQINKQERILNNDQNIYQMQTGRNSVGAGPSIQQSPRLQLIEIGQININQDIRYYLDMVEQIKIENEQLKELNRKLVSELENYRYKDSLKEAEYILEHRYNEMLLPQRYKYIFDQKQKYLQAINFNFKNEQEIMQTKVDNTINEMRELFAEEHEEMQQTLSDLIKELVETTMIKDDIEAQLDFVVQDSVEQIRVHIEKYNEEHYNKKILEQENTELKKLSQHLQEKLTFYLAEQEKLNKDLSDMQGFNKEMNKRIRKYQKMYNDVDINQIHEKITLLSTENDYYKNLSQRLQNMNMSLKMKARTLLMQKKDDYFGQNGEEGGSKESRVNISKEIEEGLLSNAMKMKPEKVILEGNPDEEQDRTDKHMHIIRPDFETQLEKSNFSLMARF